MESNLAAIRKLNQQNPSQPTAAQFVVYNFPDRDCSASSSAGELSVSLSLADFSAFVRELT
jgi:cellulose 1,4-beta-cellobiosidase